MSVAARVSEEMNCALGSTVGYAVRFDDCRSPTDTRIVYMTDGMLVRETMMDPLLSKYCVIMVDEAHERSVHTDVLLGLLKKIMSVRMDLRLVISSATIDAEEFVRFFTLDDEQRAPPAVVSVSGRQYPVDIHYLKQAVPDYVLASLETVLEIHTKEPAGDILVFLTGREECDRLVTLIADQGHTKGHEGLGLFAVPIYATMPAESQMEVFVVPARRMRKVVVATNIAETSITVPGVRYVIDCGFVKIKWFNPTCGMDSLTVVPTSQASANQRAGRAGRVMPGKCYRLYPESQFALLPLKAQPEIQRSDLSMIVLQLKVLHIADVVHFDYMSPPPAAAMSRALEMLHCLGAIDDEARLTQPIGSTLAEFPSPPQITRMLIASATLGVSEHMLSIASMLSVQDVFVQPKNLRGTVDAARRAFAVVEGDHVTLLNVYNSFLKNGQSAGWCKKFFINHRAMVRAAEVRAQMRSYMIKFGIPLNQNAPNMIEAIQRSLIYGLFSNVAQLQADASYRSIRGGQSLYVHPNSSLFKGTLPQYVVYGELVFTHKPFMRDVTPVQSEWLVEIAPQFYTKTTSYGI